MRNLAWTCCVVFVIESFCSSGLAVAQTDEEITNSIGMKLRLISKGEFKMGSPPDEQGSRDNELLHDVTITKDYYLGVTEVTQGQFKAVMESNPSHFQGIELSERHPVTGRALEAVDSTNHPVENVIWDEAVEFCRRLSELPEEKAAGRVYRLPTEAEWEYACRAGTTTAFASGRNLRTLERYAWLAFNSDNKTHAVRLKKPNAWGLYDMHGNVSEFCSDSRRVYESTAAIDPVGPDDEYNRAVRGGSWKSTLEFARSAARPPGMPWSRLSTTGFRVALDALSD